MLDRPIGVKPVRALRVLCDGRATEGNPWEQVAEKPPIGVPLRNGSVTKPSAEPGNLCVYTNEIQGGAKGSSFWIQNPGTGPNRDPEEAGASPGGAILNLISPAESGAEGFGTWR